jgi:hypothetical protein
MMAPNGKVVFGAWRPDITNLENGGLVEALNVLPLDGHYAPFLPMLDTGAAMSANRVLGGVTCQEGTNTIYVYAGDATDLYVREVTGSAIDWVKKTRQTASVDVPYTIDQAEQYWSFAQYDDLVIATNYVDDPQAMTVADGGKFTALATDGTAPQAKCVGIIGQFVMLGDTIDGVNGVCPYRVQWCSIAAARTWPTPGSIQAGNEQAGEEFLNPTYGKVQSIANGEAFGLVFQQRGITRFTYVGGQAVWQVQTYERTRGAWAPRATVQVGPNTYFLSSDGFYVTDGQNVKPIGDEVVTRWFMDDFDSTYLHMVTPTIDHRNRCIYWSYPSRGASGEQDSVIIYSWANDRWSHADQLSDVTFPGVYWGYSLDELDEVSLDLDILPASLDSERWKGGRPGPIGFTQAAMLAKFIGTAGTATLETAEVELNSNQKSTVLGIKPLVTGGFTSVTCTVGYRDHQEDDITWDTARTPNTRTKVCDVRRTAVYHSVRTTIVGEFDKAIGVQFDAEAAGYL